MMPVFIETKCLSKHYTLGSSKIKALDDINLRIYTGDFILLKGPSGSGKSTLLNLLGCLDEPSVGEVLIRETPIRYQSSSQLNSLRRELMSFIFPQPNLIPILTAYENIEYPLLIRGVAKKIRQHLIEEYSQKTEIHHLLDHLPTELSMGEQQRVAITRAIVTHPALILADEPTSNLNSSLAHKIMSLLKQLNTDLGITFVISTHDESLVQYAKTILQTHDGQITAVV